MNSSAWGPSGWKFMFYIAMGYDFNETPKEEKDLQYKAYFKSMGDVLCCKYCRQSYSKFYESLNIDKYLQIPNCGLVRFVYDLKELVNKKLRDQEKDALKEEFEKLKTSNISETELWEKMREKGHKICYTKPTPPFEEVVSNLLKDRAGCSAHLKTCREPILNTNYPVLPNVLLLNESKIRDKDLYFGGLSNRKKSIMKGGNLKKKSNIKKKSKRKSKKN